MALQIIAALCAGIAAFCAAWAGLTILSEFRLERKVEEKQLPVFLRLTTIFAPNLRFITRAPAFEGVRKTLGEKIIMAGYDEILDPDRFLAARFVLGAIGVGMFILMFSAKAPVIGLCVLALMVAWPNLWLWRSVKTRHEQIQKALPNVLDLLTLSVEAGKDFVSALRDILSRRRRDALTEELEIAFREIQLGKQRRKALRDMGNRVKQHDLTQVVNAIAQADELGVSIGHLLRIQSDQLRQKRFQRAEKQANEAPVKILVPVVIFIFPTVFIILVPPILFHAAKVFIK